jgi:hypothetical protein
MKGSQRLRSKLIARTHVGGAYMRLCANVPVQQGIPVAVGGHQNI